MNEQFFDSDSFTPRARELVKNAVTLAGSWGHTYIGTEHILLSAAINRIAPDAVLFAKENASAAVAAKNGCVDGIIAKNDIRQTLMDSIEVMAGKRISRLPKKHSNIQL